MKRFWYMISEQNIVQEMLEASLGSERVSLDCLYKYQCELRIINDGAKKYYLLPFAYNFSTPMKGLNFYTTKELKIELAKEKWLHNNEGAI